MTLHMTSWVYGGLTAGVRCWSTSRVAIDLGHIGAYVTSLLCIQIHLGYKIYFITKESWQNLLSQSSDQSINHRITKKKTLRNQREAKLPDDQ